jgi:predicted MFS family arabinose efflux permease
MSDLAPSASAELRSERLLVLLVGAVQFVNILDFMIVMPLGPDFAVALGIPASRLGFIGGSYTAAASVAGLVGGLFLDRFDRRKALAVAMGGLVLGTLAGGFAVGLGSLLAARVLAGFFGGPATSISLSIIADAIPPARRGKAMGSVMGAFSAASVLGVPAGLELAWRGSWRLPFFSVGLLGAVITAGVVAVLPPMRAHLEVARPRARLSDLLTPFRQRLTLLSLGMTATAMIGGFAIIPNISAYVQNNLGYPRSRIGLLYMVGGAASFVSMRAVGRLVDRYGSARVGTVATVFLLADLYVWFVAYTPAVPVLALFLVFMLANSSRNVPYNTLTSKVPAADERARFLSIQSAVQHLAGAAGAFLSSLLLHELPDGRLEGIPHVAAVSMTMMAAVPVFLWIVEAGVRARDAAARDA